MMDAANDASKQADSTATTPQESAAAAQPEPQAQAQAAQDAPQQKGDIQGAAVSGYLRKRI